MPDTPTNLVVGEIGPPVGLRGEMQVLVLSDDPTRFAPGATVLLEDSARPLTVRRTRGRRDRTVVSFEEISDRTEAEALRGSRLVVPVSSARALDADEYWDHELIGALVVTAEGTEVGRVAEVLHPAANDVLVVRSGDREHLVPLVAAFVRGVDRAARRIEIEPIPGLLDE